MSDKRNIKKATLHTGKMQLPSIVDSETINRQKMTHTYMLQRPVHMVRLRLRIFSSQLLGCVELRASVDMVQLLQHQTSSPYTAH